MGCFIAFSPAWAKKLQPQGWGIGFRVEDLEFGFLGVRVLGFSVLGL